MEEKKNHMIPAEVMERERAKDVPVGAGNGQYRMGINQIKWKKREREKTATRRRKWEAIYRSLVFCLPAWLHSLTLLEILPDYEQLGSDY